MEQWKAVIGYEGLYEVSDCGRVKALDRYVMNNGGLQHRSERILKPTRVQGGYQQVILCKDGTTKPFRVHRLVAQAFIPNPENKPFIDHIDTITSNNHASNLRWVTRSENCNNPLTRKHLSEAKMGHPFWGRPLTEEERKRQSEALKGRTLSEEHRKKLSIAHKESEKVKIASAINIKKAQESNKGRARSEETKRKISERHKGRTYTIVDGKRVYHKKGE